jgi:hypothetical protein
VDPRLDKYHFYHPLPDFTKLLAVKQPQQLITDNTENIAAGEIKFSGEDKD